MALQLRPNCECCDKDLPPSATDARICSYECTFCADCVETKLFNVCPNCGGGFVPRPIRPAKEWRPGMCFVTHTPGRHSCEGRIGRGTKPPPQFGQTLDSFVSTQFAQKVHSYEQMRASVAAGGRSLSQYSQFGRSCNAMMSALFHLHHRRRTDKSEWRISLIL